MTVKRMGQDARARVRAVRLERVCVRARTQLEAYL